MRSLVLLILLVVSLIVGLATGFQLLFRLVYVIGIVLLVCYVWAWTNVLWVTATRKARSVVAQVGQEVEERITVVNSGWLPKLWLEVRDHSTAPGHLASNVVNLPAGKSRTWKVKTICTQRGRFTLGPITLRSSDPFGLFHRRRTLDVTTNLLVYPRMLDLSGFELPTGELPGETRLRRRTHNITPNASGIREYAPGDSYNRIHWPTTARAGKLMVKEFELDPSSDVWIFLDMHNDVQAGKRLESTEEYGVTIAASLAKRFLDSNRSVGMIAYAQHHEISHPDKGSRQLSKMAETLAVVRAEGQVPIAEMIAAEGQLFGRNTGLVIITPSTDETWVNSLQQLTSRGVKAVVILLEASTFGAQGNSLMVVSRLAAGEVTTYLVKRGDPLDRVLSTPSAGSGRGRWNGLG